MGDRSKTPVPDLNVWFAVFWFVLGLVELVFQLLRSDGASILMLVIGAIWTLVGGGTLIAWWWRRRNVRA